MKSTKKESAKKKPKRLRSPRWLIVWLVPTVLLCWFWLWWVGVIYALIMIFPIIFWGLAEDNIYFTFTYEGTAKIVTRGGAFWKVLLQWEGHELDEKGCVVEIKLEDENAPLPKRKRKRKPFRQRLKQLFGGLRYYGFWPLVDILVYEMQWWGVDGKGEVDFHPKEMLDFVLVRPDLYWGEVQEAKDKNLLPLRVEFIITLQIVNPRKALFDIQNYLEAVIERLKTEIRDKITNSSYEELVVDSKNAAELIYEGISDLRDEFTDDYGVELVSFDIKNIDPPEDYDEQTMAAYIAEQEAKKIERLAQARATEITLINEAVKSYGDLGVTIRTLEALEKSPLAASMIVQKVPGLEAALKSLGGFKGEVSKEELKGLLEDLKVALQEIQEGRKEE